MENLEMKNTVKKKKKKINGWTKNDEGTEERNSYTEDKAIEVT